MFRLKAKLSGRNSNDFTGNCGRFGAVETSSTPVFLSFTKLYFYFFLKNMFYNIFTDQPYNNLIY